MIRYLIAMEREAELFKKVSGIEAEIIGINAVNMGEYSEDDILVNIGYAGGYKVPVGALIEPYFVIDAESFDMLETDSVFPIDKKICITANDFVTEPVAFNPAVYDMELYKIAQKPHKKLYAIKIVSDSLNEAACEEFNAEEPWRKAVELVLAYVREE